MHENALAASRAVASLARLRIKLSHQLCQKAEQPFLESGKWPNLVDRLSDLIRLDGFAFEWVAAVPREEMHMEVRE